MEFCSNFCDATYARDRWGFFGTGPVPAGHCTYCGAVIANVQEPNPFIAEGVALGLIPEEEKP